MLQRGQEGEAAEAIAAGHANYPSFRSLFPDDKRRRKVLRWFFAATVRDAIPFGSVLAAQAGDRIDGVAVWLPPSAFPWTPARKLRAFPAFTRIMAAAPRAFPRFMRYGSNMEAAHRGMQHWYLVVLSVRPEMQGRGLGSALLTPILERADRDGIDCSAETADPANIAYYRRFGFEVVDPAFAALPEGPPLTVFHRPPAPHGRGGPPTREVPHVD
ncbi:MAG: GNAT family N-acetyltransferase [Acidimicrobiia bacterium]